MEKVNKILIVIFLLILFGVMFYSWNKINSAKQNKDNIEIIDTTYNKVVLDSIEYRIYIKDSVIVELKKQVKYEIEQAINANDSDAVKQFYKLAGSD